jgi:hypothetical protein
MKPRTTPLPSDGCYPVRLVRSRFPRFVDDSMDRGIFEPWNAKLNSMQHEEATLEQMRALLSDAKFYADPFGPDECPAGIISSAKRLIEYAKREWPEWLEK